MFWRLTLREITNVLDGTAARFRREHNDRAWLAWHTAWLTAYAPTKARDFTPLKRLLQDAQAKKAKPQDWRAEFAAFSAWAGSFKGKS